MQKSAHPSRPAHQYQAAFQRSDSALADKGAKFEPFWNAAFGSDRRSLQRVLKADQKR